MKRFCWGILAVALVGFATGCAFQKTDPAQKALDQEIHVVRSRLETSQMDIDSLRKEVEAHNAVLNNLKSKTADHEKKIEQVMSSVDEALKRAEEAGKLSKGKLIYEVIISDESVGFAFNKSELTQAAKAELDIFAEVLLEQNDPVYIEVQGHTDNIGSEQYNLKLGQRRAEAVLRYLHENHAMPLHHMSPYSYGETKPVADNRDKAGRAKNRRVMLLVME